MTFQDGLQDLIGKPVVHSKYIHGSIFHLLFAANGGEVELVCNGCQWIVLGNAGEVLLHDEAVLSSKALSGGGYQSATSVISSSFRKLELAF